MPLHVCISLNTLDRSHKEKWCIDASRSPCGTIQWSKAIFILKTVALDH